MRKPLIKSFIKNKERNLSAKEISLVSFYQNQRKESLCKRNFPSFLLSLLVSRLVISQLTGMATGLTVGGWFISAFLDTLVDKVSSYVLQRYGLLSSLHEDLSKLQTSLIKVQALIVNAEKRQIKGEESVSELLKRLKEATYDADDLIGDFEYQQLQLKVESKEDPASSFLTCPVSLASNSSHTTTKIREIHERLDTIAAALKEVLEVLSDVGRKQEVEIRARPETSSFLTELVVFGRDEELEKLAELLLKSEHASGYISVLPVVGIGGIGKTTLAQLIYKDQRITEHFQLRIWICVSDPFDVKRIAREMVESVSWECRTDLTNLNQLQLLLQEKLLSKRYLLVLDDVWNEDRSKWENLCAPLRFGLQGSKILVTTRSQKVSDIVSATEPMFIKGLSNDSYWSFFKRCAFGCRNSENYPKLEVIGNMISSKLKGLPLAAKTLGGLLSIKLDEEHWRSIMESEIWELQQGENDILPVLKLSYQHLPACLKQCFAYCSLFPKDYRFDKDSLIQMWMAQGFIRPKGNMRMEDVGSDCFNDLLCRSFFQQHSWCKNIFIMHDLLHDLAQGISRDECFRIEDDKSKAIPNTVRHLSVCIRKLKLSEVDLSSFKKLRTLIFIYGYGPDPGWVLDDLLKESTSIRVMNLGYLCMTELPDNIGDFKQLRYLDISHTDISTLPESLCRLYNLQFLKLKPYLRVSFPKGMKNLTSLRKLDADEDSVAQITGIGNLTSLQELCLFKVEKEPGRMIKELSDMTELRGSLWISNLENIDNKEEASQAILNNKKYLNELCFKWLSNRNAVLGIDVSYADVLEGLQPHSNIGQLKIISYGGVRYPSWLDTKTLPNLETIYFANCKSLEQLPSLERWPFLKFLRFGSMHAVKHVNHLLCGTTKLTGFPVLEKLKCWNMPEWEEWSAANASQRFPCLRELYIKNCPKLRGLPCIPASLRKLKLLKVGLNELPEAWIGSDITNGVSEGSSTCRSTSLSLLHVKKCPNLTSLGKWLLPDCSPDTREICIVNCLELTSLPVERFKDLACLEYLELRECPKLVQAEVSKFLLPSSLQQLILGACGNLHESLPGCLQNLPSLHLGDDWLSTHNIPSNGKSATLDST